MQRQWQRQQGSQFKQLQKYKARDPVQSQRSEGQQGPKIGGPVLKQPQFNWEATDKYTEWNAFILEVRNILSMYNALEQDKIAMVKNWLGRKGLHYLESLTEAENMHAILYKDC